MLQAIRFLRPVSPYNVDEVAGFPPDQAKKLIDSGSAVPFVTDASENEDDDQSQVSSKSDGTKDTIQSASSPDPIIEGQTAGSESAEGQAASTKPAEDQAAGSSEPASPLLVDLKIPHADKLVAAQLDTGEPVELRTLADLEAFLAVHDSISALKGFGGARAREVEEAVALVQLESG